MRDKILNWIINGKTGTSSMTIASVMADLPRDDMSHPYDPADFNRCLLLIEAVPEIESRLHEMSRCSEEWKILVEHWEELKELFISEVGMDWSKGTRASKTYDKMQELFKKVSK